MKTIILDGRVGANGTEVKTTKTGKPYARFSMANNTYINGEEKTEWYDVISYDPTFIEKRAQYLGKGSYVIVTGSIRTEVNVGQDNKVWINHYITATTIDTPRFGGKKENEQDNNTTTTPQVSTYTGGTKSDYTAQATAKPENTTSVNSSYDEDDLPF